MRFGFGKKKNVTAGGSEVLRHGAAQSVIGIPPDIAERNCRARERIYERFFGPCDHVHHEVGLVVPHIDVYVYPPGQAERDFYTYVTGGMSDLPMRVPREEKTRRTELVLYTRQPQDGYATLLRALAHFPHDHRNWLGHGHTFPNGDPPLPLFPGSQLDTLLFIPTILSPDARLSEQLRIENDPVSLLWVVPLTSAECRYKLQYGVDAVLDLFERVQHPFVLDERRRSYV